MSDELRLPPQDLQAERCLIGCMMLNGDTIDAVREIVQPRDFHADSHGEIARAIYELADAGLAANYVSISDQMRASNTLNEIGGPAYILECFQSVPEHSGDDWHATSWAKIVAKCSRRRQTIAIGRKLIEDSYSAGRDDDATREAAIAAATSLASIGPTGKIKQPVSLAAHLDTLVANLRAGITPTKFDGIHEIDQIIGGTCDGEVIVIAASSHHGKTLVALQWIHEAARVGTVCGVISEEMSSAALASRTLSSITAVVESKWRESVESVAADVEAHREGTSRVFIAEKCSSIGAVERVIAELVDRYGVKLIAVDYAQLIRGEGGNRQERVADVSVRLKNAAMRHGIRILVLAQLNRGIDRRDDPSPIPSDIADTSQIEKDADVILMLFYPFKFDDKHPCETEYRIYHRKNRNRGNQREKLRMTLNRSRVRLEPRSEYDRQRDWVRENGHNTPENF